MIQENPAVNCETRAKLLVTIAGSGRCRHAMGTLAINGSYIMRVFVPGAFQRLVALLAIAAAILYAAQAVRHGENENLVRRREQQ